MGDEPDGDDQVFIVRAWREAGRSSEGEEEWRGRIDHLNRGRRAHFVGLVGLQETLVALMQDVAQGAPAAPSAEGTDGSSDPA